MMIHLATLPRQVYFFCCFLLLLEACGPSTPQFVEPPVVVSHPKVPQLALLRFTADEPVRALIKMTDGHYTWDIHPPGLYKQKMEIPFFQLRPATEYRFTVQMIDTRKNIAPPYDREVVYRSPDLPVDFPQYELPLLLAAQREPGFNLLSITDERSLPEGPIRHWLIVLDREGRVMWYTPTEEALYELRHCRGGTVIGRTESGRLLELDWRAEVRRTFVAARTGTPGEIVQRPVGEWGVMGLATTSRRTYLVLGTDTLRMEGAGGTVGEDLPAGVLTEFRQSGRVVRRWPLGDYVPAGDSLSRNAHYTAVDIDEREGLVYALSTEASTLLALDWQGDSLRWVLGPSAGDRPAEQPWLLRGEDWDLARPRTFRATPYHSLLFVDQPLGAASARLWECEIDAEGGRYRKIWSYDPPDSLRFQAATRATVARLPRTENVLYSGLRRDAQGERGMIAELTHDSIPQPLLQLLFAPKQRLNGLLHLPDLRMKMEGE
ncbi:MAG: hypothetical protein AAFW73_05245 [Bacteroidota bacterium]